MFKTKIVLSDPRARVPNRCHDSDTGYDLLAIDIKNVEGDTIFLRTGLSVRPPEGYYFEIVPRSSMSKLPISLANSVGVIDEHYTGEILIPIRVLSSSIGMDAPNRKLPNGIVKMFGIKPQTLYDVGRLLLAKKPILVQLILRKRLDTSFEEVESLGVTSRGDGGFGSTDGKPVEIAQKESKPKAQSKSGRTQLKK